MSESALRKRINIANAMDSISLNDNDVFFEQDTDLSADTVCSEQTVSTDNTEDFVELRQRMEELEAQVATYRLQSYGLSGLLVYLLVLYTAVTVGSIF